MAKSLKVNFVFNFANTIFGLLFPLITFPYISRVLLADGIGLVQFFQSIINYISANETSLIVDDLLKPVTPLLNREDLIKLGIKKNNNENK